MTSSTVALEGSFGHFMELLYDFMEAKTQHGGTGCSVMSLRVVPAHCNQKMEIISLLHISLFKMVRVGGPFYILVL